MRLVQINGDDQFSLIEYVGHDVPPYAILSHTWGPDNEEVTYNDLVHGTGGQKVGFHKLRFCQNQATLDGLKYFWLDTCCIDKSSSAELSEAINSMYKWYQSASKCYVYMADVTTGNDTFRQSRWFTRGCTLQELIAPTVVEFFSAEGEKLGDKKSLVQELHNITHIPIGALQGNPLTDFSINERLLWAENRSTKREEDAAYSLLGIFDIYMPLIYGEGKQRALRRLHKEIRDYLSEEANNLSPDISSIPLDPNDEPLPAYKAIPPEIVTPMWPGNILRTKLPATYLAKRDQLSNAAYYGQWAEVIMLIDLAKDVFEENWTNAVRLSNLKISPLRSFLPFLASKRPDISFWTPLHQAAYMRAPINVVKELIAKGASRTLRTRRADKRFSASSLTAHDIALEMGYTHLLRALAPIIQHAVPPRILAHLQLEFHKMIKRDGKASAEAILPELDALTELREPEMWFPVSYKSMGYEMGYRYRLTNNSLMVTKIRIERVSPRVYFITKSGVKLG